MTSSLVGSEMCIRDRYFKKVVAPVRVVVVVDASYRSNEEISDCLAPVSYTRLTLPTICSV
eukprot:3769456-Prorocentrum_lima.AAC.1